MFDFIQVVSKWEACNYRDQIAVNIFNQTDHKLDKQQIEEQEQDEEVDEIGDNLKQGDGPKCQAANLFVQGMHRFFLWNFM